MKYVEGRAILRRVCPKCKYKWYPRTPAIKPKRCPQCQARLWREVVVEEPVKDQQ